MLKNKGILKITALLVMLFVSVVALTGCEFNKDKKDENAYEQPIKNLVEGLSEGNSAKFLEAFPGFISDYVKDIFTDEYLKSVIDEQKENYGDNITMSYKITKTEEISAEDLASKQNNILETYGKEVSITKGYKLDVEMTTKGDKTEDVDTDNMEVYEIDGKWCMIDF